MSKLSFVKKIENKYIRILVTFSPIIISVILALFWLVNVVVVLLHLIAIWSICTFIGFLVKKILKREWKKDFQALAAIVITIVYMCFGFYNYYDVTQTDYSISTNKDLGGNGIKIVEISDSHFGAHHTVEKFKKEIEDIQNNVKDIDAFVVVGDFVDDGTSKEEMIKSCEALKDIKTKYGVYFVYGNHDKGLMGNGRGYSGDDIAKELEKNNVKVLEDEAVLVDDRFYILGRRDKREISRKNANELVEKLDKSKYIVDLNHQPNDYEAEKNAGIDLVLSGHTHGGQFIPFLKFGEWTNLNDYTYGHKKIDKTDFIVSSGIADWELVFKTGCISEYVVINIEESK